MDTTGAQPTEELEAMDTQPIRHDEDEWEWKRQRAHQTHQLNSIALETTRELPAIPETGERRVDRNHAEIAKHIQVRRAPKVRPVESWSFTALNKLYQDVMGLSIYKRRT
jgi:hypothetical protein